MPVLPLPAVEYLNKSLEGLTKKVNIENNRKLKLQKVQINVSDVELSPSHRNSPVPINKDDNPIN